MRVIGTAGHVDHGKSTLVQALTGVHPDRLKEEQAREMTIDLGFAWMNLPGENEWVGVVDVPGHRDFIENMLAGVGGIDAVLFVVAADEGVMPQTREHLAILDLLSVPAGLIVLTKSDLVESEWLDLVREDVRAVMRGTVLQDAPMLAVSARNKTGLEALKATLAEILRNCPPRLDFSRPRLPVDRVFTIAGFGTVVTGTLLDGQFNLGDEVLVLPRVDVRGRVRGLQTHKQKVERAVQGSRVAINISGVDVSDIQRGNVIALPGTYNPTSRLDVFFRLLPGIGIPLKHGLEVKFFLGAAEVPARVRLLGVEGINRADHLAAGEEGWLQLELDAPVIAVRGDRYILRRPSPGETLGGGEIVDPHPPRRHKRFDPKVLDGLRTLRRGSPAEILLQAWLKMGVVPLKEGLNGSGMAERDSRLALAELLQSGELVILEPNGNLVQQAGSDAAEGRMDSYMAMPETMWRLLCQGAQAELGRYHQQNPLRRGMPREEFKSRMKLPARVMNDALKIWSLQGTVVEHGQMVASAGHAISFTASQQGKITSLMTAFRNAPYSPPSVKECHAIVGAEVYAALVELGELFPVSEDVVFRKADYDKLVSAVLAHFKREPTLTVAQFRDQFNTSRRYALAFLEHLDARHFTVRDGDARRLGTGAES